MERRTTIVLPEEVYKELKVEIVNRDISIKDFICKAVKEELLKGDAK